MSIDALLDLGREGLWLVVLLSALPVGVAFVVSLVSSVIQAATQLNEQTIALAPKIIAVFISLIVCGTVLAMELVERGRTWWAAIAEIGS